MAVSTRKSAATRREEIVEAVLRIVGERGLTSLTTTSIAQEIGLTSGALFRHFDSREAILREVVRHALVSIESTFPDPALPPLERLRRLAMNRVRLLGANPGLAWLLRSEQVYLALPEDAVVQLTALHERSKRFLLDALRDGAAQGSIRNDIKPELLLVPVMGTVHALAGMPGVRRLVAGTRSRNPDRILDALASMLAPPSGTRAGSELS